MAVAELPVADTLARPLRDLRISVTDRCQFRCTYCMPREVFGRDFTFLPREQLLSFEELARLVRVFAGLGVHELRLIEYMDVGTTNGWRLDEVVPAAEIICLIGGQWPVAPAAPAYPGEVARRYRYRDGAGEIGVIASVTQPFCRGCTRARLSADGKLYTCLFAGAGHDLRGPLRAGATDQALREQISAIWARRADRYSEQRNRQT